ncbi:MAG: Na-K-Cl cotransporter [Gemmatimonadales bacterium]|nr:MAG: Na-K-Cl cotransporter [Gemmatimonadales bacterium]
MTEPLRTYPPEEPEGHRRYGAFAGVFTPTLLTILGVIMYLREGWVVGNAGIVGGLLIILLAFGITSTTGLALSSITTNIRIGAGGAYSIISQSLGLEVGGSVGIPLYLSQALVIALYIFGFREGWLWIFPHHPALAVDLAVFAVLFGIALISAGLAFRIQYVILAVIAASLVSVGVAAAQGSMIYDVTNVGLWGDFPGTPEDGFPGTSFWVVFAVFFPAATGIMAGANMSGELKDPRRSIPLGTMSAIAVSLVIYLLLAYWLARSASPEELQGNYTIMVERAAWGPAVVAGLLGATFSSGLASFVGAPRILQALAAHGILPRGRWLERRSRRGEPRNAIIITGGIVLAALMLRDLNAIAPLITLFFLITYAMINVVVFVEQSLGLISFRPSLRIPRFVPFLGGAGCIFAMFIMNPGFSLVAVGVVIGAYFYLTGRHLEAPFKDVRSGLFFSLAEWAAKKVATFPPGNQRAWKPNLLVPVEDPVELRGSFEILESVAYPKGSLVLVGLNESGTDDELSREILPLRDALQARGLFASATIIDYHGLADGLTVAMQSLQSAFFRPNMVFLTLPRNEAQERAYPELIREAERRGLGVLLYAPHPRAGLGRRTTVNVWTRDRSPDWSLEADLGNLDLAILTAFLLRRNWGAELRIITVVSDPDQEDAAREYMERLVDQARLGRCRTVVGTRSFREFLGDAPSADVNIFGLSPELSFQFAQEMVDRTESTCLFVRDSGQESALA